MCMWFDYKLRFIVDDVEHNVLAKAVLLLISFKCKSYVNIHKCRI